MKSKALAVWLTFCLVAPITTTFFVLQYQRRQIKTAVEEKVIAGIDPKELVLLKLTEAEKLAELSWEETQEFEYQGEMYDVVKTNTVGDTTYYWVWRDYEETVLNKQLEKLASFALDHNPIDAEDKERWSKFLETRYLPGAKEKWVAIFRELKHQYYFKQLFFRLVFLSPPIPPPKKSSVNT